MTVPPPSSLDGPQASDLSQLRKKSVRGGTITLLSQAANVLIHLVSTVTLARVLSPEEYGVIAMVLAITAFAGLFRDLGLSSSTIQRDKLTHEQLSTLFWINVAAGATLTALVAAASPLVAWFYGRPELTPVTLALSLTFLIGSFSTQQGALLTRQMRFGRKATATLTGAVVTLATAIALALHGFSYWSLVIGNLAGAVITTLLLNTLSGWRPGAPARRTGVRSMLKYGANITGFDLVNYFHRNLDNLLIGRVWGADALGLYSRAYQLMMYPVTHLRGPINAVAFPALSRLQTRPEDFRAYYRKVTHLLAFSSMPAMAFFYVAAAPVIELALGSRWSGVVPIFSVLAAVAFIQPVASLRGVVLLSLGKGRRYLWWGVWNAAAVSLAFLIGVRWGANGVAVGYCIVTYVILYPSLVYVFHGTPLKQRDFFGAIARPAATSLIALAATKALSVRVTDWDLSLVTEVVTLAAAFAAAFFVSYALIPGGLADLKKLRRLANEIVGRK